MVLYAVQAVFWTLWLCKDTQQNRLYTVRATAWGIGVAVGYIVYSAATIGGTVIFSYIVSLALSYYYLTVAKRFAKQPATIQ